METHMKKIEAVIRKEKFPEVDQALKATGVGGLTYITAEGRGRSRGEEMLADRGTRTYRPEYVERIKLEVIVKDSDMQRVIDAIMRTASTHSIGDGKIFLTSIEQVYDISSSTSGESAL